MVWQKLTVRLEQPSTAVFTRTCAAQSKTRIPSRNVAVSRYFPCPRIGQFRTGTTFFLRRAAAIRTPSLRRLKCQANAGSRDACAVVFKTHRHTAFGEHLRVVGKDVRFGAWHSESAPTMEWGDGDSWTLVMKLPPGRYVFKCVIFNETTQTALWEDGDDRVLEVEPGSSTIEVCMVFGSTQSTEINPLSFEEASSYLMNDPTETLSPLESLNNFYDAQHEYNGFSSFTDWDNTKESMADSTPLVACRSFDSAAGAGAMDSATRAFSMNGSNGINTGSRGFWEQYSDTANIHPEILEVLNANEGLLSSQDESVSSGSRDDDGPGEDIRVKFGLKPYKSGSGGAANSGPPEVRIKDLQAELRRANNIRARLKEELSKVVVQSIESQKEVSKLQSEVQTLLTQRNSTLLQLSNMQSAVKESTKDVNRLKAELEGTQHIMKTSMGQLQTRVSELEVERKSATSEVNRLRTELDMKETELKNQTAALRESIWKLEDEKQEMVGEVTRLMTQLEDKETNLKAQQSALQQTIVTLETEKEQIHGQVGRLRQQLSEKDNELKNQTAALRQTIIKLEGGKAEQTEELHKLREQLEDKEAQWKSQMNQQYQSINELENEKARMANEIKFLKHRIEEKEHGLEAQARELKQAIETLEEEKKRTANEVSVLRDQLGEKHKALQSVTQAHTHELSQQIAVLESERQEALDEIDKLHNAITHLQYDKERALNDVSRLKDMLEAKESEFSRVAADLQFRVDKMERQLAESESDRQRLKEEVNRMAVAAISLENERAAQKQHIQQVEQERTRVLDELAGLRAELASRSSGYSTSSDSWGQSAGHGTEDEALHRLQRRIDDLESDLRNSETERSRLKDEMNRLAVASLNGDNAGMMSWEKMQQAEEAQRKAMRQIEELQQLLANKESQLREQQEQLGRAQNHLQQSYSPAGGNEYSWNSNYQADLRSDRSSTDYYNWNSNSTSTWNSPKEDSVGAFDWSSKQDTLASFDWSSKNDDAAGSYDWSSKKEDAAGSYDWSSKNDDAAGSYDWSSKKEDTVGSYDWSSKNEDAAGSYDWSTSSAAQDSDHNGWSGETHWYIKQMEEEQATAAAAAAEASQNSYSSSQSWQSWGNSDDEGNASQWGAAVSAGGWDDDQRTHWFVKQMEEEREATEHLIDSSAAEAGQEKAESWDDDNRVHWYVRQMEAEMHRQNAVWNADQNQQERSTQHDNTEWNDDDRTHWFFKQQQQEHQMQDLSRLADFGDDVPVDVHGFLLHEGELSEAQQELLHDTVRALQDENMLVSGEIDAIRQTIRKMESEKVEAMTEVKRMLQQLKNKNHRISRR